MITMRGIFDSFLINPCFMKQSICVFLGARHGHDEIYARAAENLGKAIVSMGFDLVYGGSSQGIMGVLAKTVLAEGGHVTGVMTSSLIDKEKPPTNLDELIVVDSLLKRKELMQNISQAFIAMPGGLGTIDEALDIWSALRTGELDKPFGILNIENYFEHLLVLYQQFCDAGFANDEDLDIPMIHTDPLALVEIIRTKVPTTKEPSLT